MGSYSFNAATAPRSEKSYTLIPNGWYLMQIVESEVIDKPAERKASVRVTYEVMQQGFAGRKVWGNFNVRNPSAQAEKIGNEQLAELCDAVGKPGFEKTEELHNKPFLGKIRVAKNSDPSKYDDKNEVSGWKPRDGSVPSAPPAAPGASASPAPAPAAGGAAPWLKK